MSTTSPSAAGRSCCRKAPLAVFSSDHSPWNYSDKIAGGAHKPFSDVLNGIPGIETRLPLLFSATQPHQRLTLNQFVDITTTTPAKLYGLYPRKGVIALGSDADFAPCRRSHSV